MSIPVQQFLKKIAHDSGDGMTVFHCPFCGSGQVIARSDRTIECGFCNQPFTVQVQPLYPGFPQTINGQPVPVPGMPGQISPAPLNAVDPSQIGQDGSLPPEAPVEDEEAATDDEAEDEGNEGSNPFTATRQGQKIDLRDFFTRG